MQACSYNPSRISLQPGGYVCAPRNVGSRMVVRRLHITSIDHLGMPALRLVLGLPSDNVHSLDSRGCRRGGVLDHRMTTLNSLQILLGMGWLWEAAMSCACCNHACYVAPKFVNGITRYDRVAPEAEGRACVWKHVCMCVRQVVPCVRGCAPVHGSRWV